MTTAANISRAAANLKQARQLAMLFGAVRSHRDCHASSRHTFYDGSYLEFTRHGWNVGKQAAH